MAGETLIHFSGNLTADPNLTFTASGRAVCSFTVANTPKRWDAKTASWVDKDPTFFRCSAWGELAENAADSLTKGTPVLVEAEVQQRSYEDNAGVKRTAVDYVVRNVGPSLKWATATTRKGRRKNPSDQGQMGAQFEETTIHNQAAHAPEDPWETFGGTTTT